jgi:hypothetical protein
MILARDPVEDLADVLDFLMVWGHSSAHQSVWSGQAVKKINLDWDLLLFQKFTHSVKPCWPGTYNSQPPVGGIGTRQIRLCHLS